MDSVSPSLEGRRGRASVATPMRASIGCDEGRFISPEECALAPSDLSAPRSAEGFSNGLRGSSFDWVSFLKVLIAVLTALAGALGVASCVG